MKIIATNRKAGFNYQLLDKLEVGMALRGWQVKSIKAGSISIKESYAYSKNGELFLHGANIVEWKGMGELEKNQIDKDIKLLAKKEEIERWESKLKQQQATTIIPTKIYLSRGFVKMELALAKGVKKYDKRAKIKERDQIRDIERQLKQDKSF
jgi:SsrA-binding protein